jgi:hypothetical protein
MIHPMLSSLLADEHARDLRAAADRGRRTHSSRRRGRRLVRLRSSVEPCGDRPVPPAHVTAELAALIGCFFRAVSFESGARPAYDSIRDLFIDDAKLIGHSSELAEISRVDDFIAVRQRMVDSGALTSFEEVETGAITEAFGNIAHRLSTYAKRATRHGEAIEGSGLISTQFIRTPGGWKMSAMAWDDERPGLAIPDRYR